MKVVATVRTKNESRNIHTFWSSYSTWADNILIADGGSEDDTLRLASELDKADVRIFNKTFKRGGILRNPQGEHTNFLIDWAFNEEEADWIIFDDCDCWPNYLLQRMGRAILEAAEKQGYEAVYAYRLYIFKDKYFPDMNIPGQSLWAWSKDADIRFATHNPMLLQMVSLPAEDKILRISHPYVLLHNTWPTEEEIARKMEFYEKTRGAPQEYPLQYGGRLADLPAHARLTPPDYITITQEELIKEAERIVEDAKA